MSEIANVTVACQWTKRSYILITSLTETPYSLWPQKRSYAYKKIETLTWVQIPFRYWNSMINDKHLAYWSVCFLGCASAVCCGDFRLWAWPPNSLSLSFTRQHIGRLAEARLIKNAWYQSKLILCHKAGSHLKIWFYEAQNGLYIWISTFMFVVD